MRYTPIEYEVKPPAVKILQVFESRLHSHILHCIPEAAPPIGRSRVLWEVQLTFQPHQGIDIRSPVDTDFVIYLNTMQQGRRGGERLVSRFVFTGLFAALVYSPPPQPPKLLQIEYQQRILLQVKAEGKHLEQGFQDLYPQLALKMTNSPVRTTLLQQLDKHQNARLTSARS
jgi:hypothetical protein